MFAVRNTPCSILCVRIDRHLEAPFGHTDTAEAVVGFDGQISQLQTKLDSLMKEHAGWDVLYPDLVIAGYNGK